MVNKDVYDISMLTRDKKGITTDVSNYRPISLTCVLSKIQERIIFDLH